jgi:hypothetical protein
MGEGEGNPCLWHGYYEGLFLSIYYKKYYCSKKYAKRLPHPKGAPGERTMA